MNRDKLIELSSETLNISDKGSYTLNKKEYKVDKNYDNIKYPENYLFKDIPKKEGKPIYKVIEVTTVDAILSLTAQDMEVCVLNFASATNVGGGFMKGSNAQEESICRCSNLYNFLNNCENYYIVNRKLKSPLYTDYMLYSKNVTGFRRGNYSLTEPFKFNVVTAPAIMNKNAMKYGIKTSVVDDIMYKRIEKIIKVMILNNQKNIILGAFGSGAFGNNPEKVANAFKKVLTTNGLDGYFDNIIFAIYDRPDNKTNTNTFKKVFKDKIEKEPS